MIYVSSCPQLICLISYYNVQDTLHADAFMRQFPILQALLAPNIYSLSVICALGAPCTLHFVREAEA